MAETRWVRFGLGRALNAGRGSSLIGSIPRCEGDRLTSILDIGSNVNSWNGSSFTFTGQIGAWIRHPRQFVRTDWTDCPLLDRSLMKSMSYEWHVKCIRNCGGYPQPYRPPGSRGPFGVPWPGASCQKTVFRRKTRRKTRRKNSRLGISPNRLWFAARRVTRGEAQENSLTLLGSTSGGPYGIPAPARAPSDQSVLFPTSECDWESPS